MYRLIVLIGLVFTCLWSFLSGHIGIEKKAEVKTVPVNGSLAAVDALGRKTVSAGESKKRWACSIFFGTASITLTAPTT